MLDDIPIICIPSLKRSSFSTTTDFMMITTFDINARAPRMEDAGGNDAADVVVVTGPGEGLDGRVEHDAVVDSVAVLLVDQRRVDRVLPSRRPRNPSTRGYRPPPPSGSACTRGCDTRSCRCRWPCTGRRRKRWCWCGGCTSPFSRRRRRFPPPRGECDEGERRSRVGFDPRQAVSLGGEGLDDVGQDVIAPRVFVAAVRVSQARVGAQLSHGRRGVVRPAVVDLVLLVVDAGEPGGSGAVPDERRERGVVVHHRFGRRVHPPHVSHPIARKKLPAQLSTYELRGPLQIKFIAALFAMRVASGVAGATSSLYPSTQ